MSEEPRPQQQPEPAQSVPPWEAPDFTVVDTALEVTAYSLRAK
ncbi:pyrroloquinoline quinone precursor peptide PqqA [Streptomyces sp. NPDC101455]